jgi:hypothetical protein
MPRKALTDWSEPTLSAAGVGCFLKPTPAASTASAGSGAAPQVVAQMIQSAARIFRAPTITGSSRPDPSFPFVLSIGIGDQNYR